MKTKLFWLTALVASGILARRAYKEVRCAGNRKKILPDVEGNYDIDGVSYDKLEHRVRVSGDATGENLASSYLQ